MHQMFTLDANYMHVTVREILNVIDFFNKQQ